MAGTRDIKRVFVTGATGFVGSALVDHLLTRNLEICCLIHQTTPGRAVDDIDVLKSDLADFNWKQLDNFQPDVIYHFARFPGRTKEERQIAAARNAGANRRLIEWLQDQRQPPLLVFGSGTLVYGNRGKEWTDERTEINPISFQREYVEAEWPILRGQQSGLPVSVIRPPWIYGAGSWFEWFYGNHIRQKGNIPLYGRGRNDMSLIHLEDCSGLIHHIGQYGQPGETFNIYAHPPVTQKQFSEELKRLTNLSVKKYSPLRMRFQFDKTTREALTFSLRSVSKHDRLLAGFSFKYPDLRSGLESVLKQMNLLE